MDGGCESRRHVRRKEGRGRMVFTMLMYSVFVLPVTCTCGAREGGKNIHFMLCPYFVHIILMEGREGYLVHIVFVFCSRPKGEGGMRGFFLTYIAISCCVDILYTCQCYTTWCVWEGERGRWLCTPLMGFFKHKCTLCILKFT